MTLIGEALDRNYSIECPVFDFEESRPFVNLALRIGWSVSIVLHLGFLRAFSFSVISVNSKTLFSFQIRLNFFFGTPALEGVRRNFFDLESLERLTFLVIVFDSLPLRLFFQGCNMLVSFVSKEIF